jgi:hypothetical protein
MLRERVNVADFESDHFATQLVERLGWAVEDAHEAEADPDRQAADEAAAVPHAHDVPADQEADEPEARRTRRQDPLATPARRA